MNRPRHLTRAAFAGAAAAVLTIGLAPAAAASGGDPFEVIATGLDNPRHLQFHNGVLYVAESGAGGDQACAPSPEGFTACYGSTGAITAIDENGEQDRVVTGLPSWGAEGTGDTAIGPSDVAATEDGLLVTVGFGRDTAERAGLPAEFQDAGWLLKADPDTGDTEQFADIASFESSENPDGDVTESNPNAVLARDDGAVVIDSGGNSLLSVSSEGEVSLITTFPTRLQTVGVQVPEGPPVGAQVPAHSVPTSVAEADGSDIVGELTGFPFAMGGAQIYRVEDSEQTVEATGFTNVIDVEVAEDGTLYVLEIAKDGLLATPPGQVPVGRLVRVVDGEQETVADLPAPGGLAIRGSTAYVTTNATSAGAGEVVAVPLG